MKQAAYYRGKEQTYLKHFFLERYLEAVAFHIAYSHREFVYVDCFSGPWKSLDEELADTSIRIALDKLNYVRDALARQKRYAAIRAIFIEKDPMAFRELQAAIERYSRSVKATALPGTFEDNIPNILKLVGHTFAFFFIDPKGWSGFPMENIRPILQHQPGEVMVNVMYDYVNRFINFSKPSNEQSLDRFFGTSDWRDIRDAANRENAAVSKYLEQLRATGGFQYVTSTRILKPHDQRAYFHLAYATRSAKGIVEFREVEKKTTLEQEDVRARAQREHRENRTGQAELAFEPAADLSSGTREEREAKLSEANERLFRIIAGGPILYEQLQPRILEIPLVWKHDFNQMLLEEKRKGRLSIDGWMPRQRVPKDGNTIRRIQQVNSSPDGLCEENSGSSVTTVTQGVANSPG